MNRIRRLYLVLAAILAFAVLLLGNEVIMAQQGVKLKPAGEPAPQSQIPVEQEAPEGPTVYIVVIWRAALWLRLIAISLTINF